MSDVHTVSLYTSVWSVCGKSWVFECCPMVSLYCQCCCGVPTKHRFEDVIYKKWSELETSSKTEGGSKLLTSCHYQVTQLILMPDGPVTISSNYEKKSSLYIYMNTDHLKVDEDLLKKNIGRQRVVACYSIFSIQLVLHNLMKMCDCNHCGLYYNLRLNNNKSF